MARGLSPEHTEYHGKSFVFLCVLGASVVGKWVRLVILASTRRNRIAQKTVFNRAGLWLTQIKRKKV
jgi:hypothetical protein